MNPRHDVMQIFFIGNPRSRPKNQKPSSGPENYKHSVGQNDSGQHGQNDEPKPKKDVNLLVEDVEGKDAQGVVPLYVSRRAKPVECTFGHPRENLHHRIVPKLLIKIREVQYLDTKPAEFTVKEGIDQADLSNDVCKVQDFAESVAANVSRVIIHVRFQVFDQ